MKKLLLTALVMGGIATSAMAQTQITVCDGTAKNAYLPFCGFGNMDDDQKAQMIYPEALLSEMTGKQITSLVFYPADEIDWTTTNTWSMATVDAANFTSKNFIEADAAQVASTVGVYDKNSKTWTITLDEPYTYTGGNLLIETFMPKAYNGNKTFYGQDFAGTTVGLTRYNDMGFGFEVEKSSILPKVTFVCEDAPVSGIVLTEDFESYVDDAFSINPVGNWSYVDGDGIITYAAPGMTAVPNAGSAMAFMLVDTSHEYYTAYYKAHSGNRFLFTPRTRDGYDNNNWLISPELNLVNGGKLTFWALGGTGYASFEVLASSTDKNTENFTKVGESVTNLGGSWKEFTYELPAGTKHFAIHDITNSWAQAVVFGIDDITVEASKVTTAISNVAAEKKASRVAYNLAGQRVNANAKGLVIIDGKKYIVK